MTHIAHAVRTAFSCVLAIAGMLALGPKVFASQADISSTPLTAIAAAQVKPNVMLLMDTSGSMGWGHMPDEVESITKVGSVGYKSAQCNVLYFNPATTYALPKKPDGSLFPQPSFTAARYAGYYSYFVAPDATDSSVVNLSTSFQAYDGKTLRATGTTPDPAQPAYYYVYTGSQTLNYASPPCTDTDDGVTGAHAASGGGTWTRTLVSAAQQANFAVWYSYYRTRIGLTKSAASLAFTPLTDSFRVGFITVEPKDVNTDTSINQAKYVEIHDFDTTQRTTWFNKLFSQIPKGASPAREGLARVGRHYAGKQDGINTGMTSDPVQYYCQQNFTILTTDGYWNTQTESPNGGPVQIDGTTLVGQQDGTLTADTGNSPRPIYDGQSDSTQVTNDYEVAYNYGSCGSFAMMSTSQIRAATVQNLQSSTQVTQSSSQNQQSTQQNLASTTQALQSTSQITQSTAQRRITTTQNLQSTRQVLQSTTQPTQSTSQLRVNTVQNLQNTVQNLQSTAQNLQTVTTITKTVTIDSQYTSQVTQSTAQTTQSTSYTTRSTVQNLQATTQNLQSTTQNRQSTTQTTQSTAQTLKSTSQNLQSTTQAIQTTTQPSTQSTSQTTQTTTNNAQSTSQNTTTTTQVRQSTSQEQTCDARTELCPYTTPGSCHPGGYYTCQYFSTGPTLVASCTPSSPTSSNGYLTTTCAPTSSTSTGTQSCTASAASSSNNYTTTTCGTYKTGPTPVATCTASGPTSANNYTTTTCGNTSSGPTPVASCTPQTASSANGFTGITCTPVTTGPTGVASCTPSSPTSLNGYTTTTCNNGSSSSGPVASCTPQTANSGNGYVGITCSNNNTSNVPVASCTPSGATSANSYVNTTCSTNNSTATPVASCTAVSPTSANNYVSTICTPNNTGPTGVASCSASSPTAGNSYTTTSCGSNNTTNVPVASCTASGPTSGNGYTTTTCPAAVTTSNVPVQNCTASSASSSNSYVTTTCGTNNTAASPVQSCSNVSPTSANNWTTTSCTTNNSGPTNVQTCSASAGTAGNSWTTTSCAPVSTGPTGVASCTGSSPSLGNNWVRTTCGSATTNNVPVASCTAASPTLANNYVTTTCGNNTSSTTDVDTCTPVAASSANSWTATVCNTRTVSSAVVASCTPVSPTSANGHQRTSCGSSSATTAVLTCTPSANTTCSTNNTGPTPVQSCSASGPTAANSFTTTSCSTNNTTNVPVATCTGSAGTSANSWVTTSCPAPVTTGPTGTNSCTAAPANSGNNYVATQCVTNTTGPTAVQSCTQSSATSANSWTTTTCGSNVTVNVGVQSCTASGPTSGNNWVTTTCPAALVTNNVPVASCTASGGTVANLWVVTTCPAAVVSGPTGVSSCTPVSASSGNNYVATTCDDNNTGPTPVASCTPVSASAGNSWTATTCGNPVTTNVAVQNCTPSGPTSANSFKTTTCSSNNTTNVPVATCGVSSGTAANSWVTTTCPSPITTGPTPVQSCTPVTASSANNYVATTCQTATTPAVGVASCTPVTATSGTNWIATICGTNNTASVPVATCTASGPTSANGYTTTTCPTPVTTDTAVQTCAADSARVGNNYTTTTCSTVNSTPVLSTSCVAQPAIAGNNWTATICATVPGKKITYQITHTTTTSQLSGGIVVSSSTPVTSQGAVTDLDNACYPTNAVVPSLPAAGPAGNGRPGPNPTAGCTAWPCSVVTANNAGGSINSLADVAQYYYVTDLRPGMTDGVPAIGSGPEDDRLKTQHMTTFTIGLGVSGTLNYRADYRNASTVTGDFAAIRSGTLGWPVWPDPTLDYTNFDNWNNAKSIDDFWHTAVNGRGQYFSAGDPSSVVSGLAGALASVQTRVSTGAAVGASNFQPVVGDNFVYLGTYATQEWSGDITASTFNLSTGMVDTATSWSAKAKLGLVTKAFCDNRKIYLMRGAALANFSWNSQTCDVNGNPSGTVDTGLNSSEMANFDSTKIALLSQKPSMTDGTGGTVDQITPAAGANLVNFLRGQNGNEGFQSNVANKLYRTRTTAIGDIVGAQPIYVKGPTGTYADSGYAAFVSANASRTPMVYAAANDGMLHAFYAGTSTTDAQGGAEAWAIVPSTMLPSMYRLADNNYKNIHQFYVDGTPTVTDVRNGPSGAWRTMLVGGFNDGGKGYYAVDVTNPASPQAMWEFKFNAGSCVGAGASSDCNLGFSFGKPIVTKIKASGYSEGRWVVLVSSGYNNENGVANDGHGFLYVLDANTGVILYKIDTGVGDSSTPANFGQLNAYVDDASINNLALRAYGTDMLGNVWSFDIANAKAILVGQAKDSGGVPQPITTRPELAELNGKAMVFVGTGRLLGTTDSTNVQRQSIYGIVDPLSSSNPEYVDLRGSLKAMTMTTLGAGSTQARTIACSANCSSAKGWVVDLPDTGERVNIDMQLALSTLVVGSNVPTTDVCASGGYSWLSYLDFGTGEANGSFGDTPGPNSHVSERADNSLIVAVSVIRLPDRTFRTELSLSNPAGTSNGGLLDTKTGAFPTPKPTGKRVSWREIQAK